MKALKAMLLIALLRLCRLLPLTWARALGRALATLAWPLRDRSRRVTERNIELAYPQMGAAERQRMARRSYATTFELAAEMGHVWLRPAEQVLGLIRSVEGVEHFEVARTEGRGVILLGPHLGNWEVLGIHLATLGSTVILYEPPKLPGLDTLIRNARERSGTSVVPTNSRGLARLLKSVKRGGISGILPDQVPPDLNAGANAPFMGIPCFTGTLASNIIRRTGALAVFGVAERIPGGFAVRYELAEPDIYHQDTARSLAALNRGVEKCLQPCPEQYQWEYKRFRVRPAEGVGQYDNI